MEKASRRRRKKATIITTRSGIKRRKAYENSTRNKHNRINNRIQTTYLLPPRYIPNRPRNQNSTPQPARIKTKRTRNVARGKPADANPRN